MIIPITGICIPRRYNEIKSLLIELGLSPIGNYELDKSRLRSAINKKIEDKKDAKIEAQKQEEIAKESRLMEERIGAKTLGEQNKFFFNL